MQAGPSKLEPVFPAAVLSLRELLRMSSQISSFQFPLISEKS